MLTQEILREHFKYDPDTGHLFWIKQNSKNRRNLHKPVGFIDKQGYVVTCTSLGGKPKHYRVHRLIWMYIHGQITQQIDHINGIRDDNRLCNLREVTHQQNMMNKGRRKSNNLFRGIYMANKNPSSWVAEITCNGVKHYLGVYKTPEEANLVYEKARIELFKEFART
jgi:hypothetical protein